MKLLKNLFYIFLPVVLGAIVGLITSGSGSYGEFRQPPLSPPGYLFPIVWTILYLLMGLSYFFVKQEEDTEKISVVYYLQLLVNLLWPIFFFTLQWRFFSILWILLLLGLIIYYMVLVFNKKRISFYLFIPYLLWVSFATYLTIGVYLLN